MPVSRGMAVTIQNRGAGALTNLQQTIYRVAQQWAENGAVKSGSIWLTRGEQSFTNWIVGGTLFVLLVATLLACLITLSA